MKGKVIMRKTTAIIITMVLILGLIISPNIMVTYADEASSISLTITEPTPPTDFMTKDGAITVLPEEPIKKLDDKVEDSYEQSDELNKTDISFTEFVDNIAYVEISAAPLGDEIMPMAAEDFVIVGNKLTGYTGTGGNVVIPDGVVIIGSGSFQNKTTVTGVTIPNTVQIIEDKAFMGSGLMNVAIPDSVVTLGYTNLKDGNNESASSSTSYTGAFTSCQNLTSVTIGNGINYISPNTFKNCGKLSNVTIANSVTRIGAAAFHGATNLTSVTLPSGLLAIESGAFARTGLVNITIPGSVTSIQGNNVNFGYYLNPSIGTNNYEDVFGAFTYCPNLVTATILNGVTEIGSGMFSYCQSLTNVILPNSVTVIGDAAFWACSSLSSISLPQNLSRLNRGAFTSSGLTSINVPNSVTVLGTYNYQSGNNVYNQDIGVFTNCSRLNTVTIGSGITNITDNAFKDCSALTTVSMTDNVTVIGKSAFDMCSSLDNIKLSNKLTIIGYHAFNNALLSVNIPSSMTSIGDSAFYGSRIIGITIPSTVVSFSNNAFALSGLTSISIPNSVVTIGNNVFASSALTSITIPVNVQSVGTGLFNNCKSLANCNWGSGLHTIPNGTFNGCTALESMTIPNTVQIIEDKAFMGSGLMSVAIPDSVVTLGYTSNKDGNNESASSNTYYSGAFTSCPNLTSVTVGNGISYISPNTFKNCGKLSSVTIANSVTRIGAAAFHGAINLTSVNLPSGLLAIESGAFARTGLVNITIPGSVTSIQGNNVNFGYYLNPSIGTNNYEDVFGAFTYCPNLVTATILNGVTEIGSGMFSYCQSLTNVILPNSVTLIGDAAFWACSSLTSISLPQNLLNINRGAFTSSGLTSINVPNSVTVLGTYNYQSGNNVYNQDIGVFTNCSRLVSAYIGSGITTIPDNTFKNCSALNSISMSDDVAVIGKAAFYNDQMLSNRLILPRNLLIIGNQAFYGITNIRAYEGSTAIAAAAAAGYSVIIIPDPQTEKVATPVANPPSGAVASGTTVTLTTATAGATIYYTTNGSIPTTSSNVYTSPIPITNNVNINAIAIKTGMDNSAVATFSYTIFTQKFTITVTAGTGGTASGGGEYNAGATVSLNATPNSNYTFDGWYENGSRISTATNYTFQASANRTLEARFISGSSTKYTITATAGTGGTASGGGEYLAGANATLFATPNSGYLFDGWYESNTKVSSYTAFIFTVNTNRTLQARFVVNAHPDAVITVSSAQSNPGKTITISLSVENNPGFTSLGLRLFYDIDNLEAISVQNLLIGDLGLISRIDNGFIIFGWSGNDDYVKNTAIASIIFKIKDTAKDGTYPITLWVDLSTTAHDNGLPVAFREKHGNITIKSWIRGDANGDGVIDLKDATLISRYYAGYPDAIISINLSAADANRDGVVDLKDATLISRYYAGYQDAIDALTQP